MRRRENVSNRYSSRDDIDREYDDHRRSYIEDDNRSDRGSAQYRQRSYNRSPSPQNDQFSNRYRDDQSHSYDQRDSDSRLREGGFSDDYMNRNDSYSDRLRTEIYDNNVGSSRDFNDQYQNRSPVRSRIINPTSLLDVDFHDQRHSDQDLSRNYSRSPLRSHEQHDNQNRLGSSFDQDYHDTRTDDELRSLIDKERSLLQLEKQRLIDDISIRSSQKACLDNDQYYSDQYHHQQSIRNSNEDQLFDERQANQYLQDRSQYDDQNHSKYPNESEFDRIPLDIPQQRTESSSRRPLRSRSPYRQEEVVPPCEEQIQTKYSYDQQRGSSPYGHKLRSRSPFEQEMRSGAAFEQNRRFPDDHQLLDRSPLAQEKRGLEPYEQTVRSRSPFHQEQLRNRSSYDPQLRGSSSYNQPLPSESPSSSHVYRRAQYDEKLWNSSPFEENQFSGSSYEQERRSRSSFEPQLSSRLSNEQHQHSSRSPSLRRKRSPFEHQPHSKPSYEQQHLQRRQSSYNQQEHQIKSYDQQQALNKSFNEQHLHKRQSSYEQQQHQRSRSPDQMHSQQQESSSHKEERKNSLPGRLILKPQSEEFSSRSESKEMIGKSVLKLGRSISDLFKPAENDASMAKIGQYISILRPSITKSHLEERLQRQTLASVDDDGDAPIVRSIINYDLRKECCTDRQSTDHKFIRSLADTTLGPFPALKDLFKIPNRRKESSKPTEDDKKDDDFSRRIVRIADSPSRVVEIDDNLSKPDLRGELNKKKRYKSDSNPREDIEFVEERTVKHQESDESENEYTPSLLTRHFKKGQKSIRDRIREADRNPCLMFEANKKLKANDSKKSTGLVRYTQESDESENEDMSSLAARLLKKGQKSIRDRIREAESNPCLMLEANKKLKANDSKESTGLLTFKLSEDGEVVSYLDQHSSKKHPQVPLSTPSKNEKPSVSSVSGTPRSKYSKVTSHEENVKLRISPPRRQNRKSMSPSAQKVRTCLKRSPSGDHSIGQKLKRSPVKHLGRSPSHLKGRSPSHHRRRSQSHHISPSHLERKSPSYLRRSPSNHRRRSSDFSETRSSTGPVLSRGQEHPGYYREQEHYRRSPSKHAKSPSKEGRYFSDKSQSREHGIKHSRDYEKRDYKDYERRNSKEYERRNSKEFERRNLKEYERRNPEEYERRNPEEYERRNHEEYYRKNPKEYEIRNSKEYERKNPKEYERRNPGDYERRNHEEFERRNSKEYERRNHEEYEQRNSKENESRNSKEYERRNTKEYERRNSKEYERRNHEDYERTHEKYERRNSREHKRSSSTRYISPDSKRSRRPSYGDKRDERVTEKSPSIEAIISFDRPQNKNIEKSVNAARSSQSNLQTPNMTSFSASNSSIADALKSQTSKTYVASAIAPSTLFNNVQYQLSNENSQMFSNNQVYSATNNTFAQVNYSQPPPIVTNSCYVPVSSIGLAPPRYDTSYIGAPIVMPPLTVNTETPQSLNTATPPILNTAAPPILSTAAPLILNAAAPPIVSDVAFHIPPPTFQSTGNHYSNFIPGAPLSVNSMMSNPSVVPTLRYDNTSVATSIASQSVSAISSASVSVSTSSVQSQPSSFSSNLDGRGYSADAIFREEEVQSFNQTTDPAKIQAKLGYTKAKNHFKVTDINPVQTKTSDSNTVPKVSEYIYKNSTNKDQDLVKNSDLPAAQQLIQKIVTAVLDSKKQESINEKPQSSGSTTQPQQNNLPVKDTIRKKELKPNPKLSSISDQQVFQPQVARKAKTPEVYDPASPSDDPEMPLTIPSKQPERQQSSKTDGPIKIKLSCYDSQNDVENNMGRRKKSRFAEDTGSSENCVDSNSEKQSSNNFQSKCVPQTKKKITLPKPVKADAVIFGKRLPAETTDTQIFGKPLPLQVEETPIFGKQIPTEQPDNSPLFGRAIPAPQNNLSANTSARHDTSYDYSSSYYSNPTPSNSGALFPAYQQQGQSYSYGGGSRNIFEMVECRNENASSTDSPLWKLKPETFYKVAQIFGEPADFHTTFAKMYIDMGNFFKNKMKKVKGEDNEKAEIVAMAGVELLVRTNWNIDLINKEWIKSKKNATKFRKSLEERFDQIEECFPTELPHSTLINYTIGYLNTKNKK